MQITKASQITGKEASMEIDVTEDQIKAWENGQLIQNAMPNLSADEREFIMTGITPDEWDEVFGDE
tara:strand:+ start:415 stop:612 length:198 start_codon:yes stop_codon:yes gene_type:complete